MTAAVLTPTARAAAEVRAATTRLEATKEFHSIPSNDIALGRELARGGFGAVYEAVWCGVTRVAVKTLLDHVPTGAFSVELLNLARVAHPNVVRLVGEPG